MADRKPLPFIVDGRAHYSLSSYDPVHIKVNVTSVSEADIDYVLAQLLQQNGGTKADLDDPDYVAKHFQGASSKEQLREMLHSELEQANKEYAENQKLSLAAQELATRLNQAIPADEVLRVRQGLELQLRQQLAQQGVDWSEFVRNSGGQGRVDDMLDAQAREVAEEDAALAAWAEKKGLRVQRGEIPELLGIPAEHATEFLDQVEASGQMDDFVEGALRAKAASDVVASCECEYHHETPEEAAERGVKIQQLLDELESQSAPTGAKPDAPSSNGADSTSGSGAASDDGPHLKLV